MNVHSRLNPKTKTSFKLRDLSILRHVLREIIAHHWKKLQVLTEKLFLFLVEWHGNKMGEGNSSLVENNNY